MTFLEPEAVIHYNCPVADRENVGDGIVMTTNPQFVLVHSLNDRAGRQRRYRCEKCHTEITVNFSPEEL